MTSKFQEILEPAQAPTYTHPHLNVSLEDILREGRERSLSESSSSDQSHSSTSRSSSDGTPKSPTTASSSTEDKASLFRKRAFTLGSKKGRRAS